MTLALLVAACQAPESSTTLAVDNTRSPATVTWVHDGDTIVADTDGGEVNIRLIGINAPDDGECLEDRATEHLIDTLKGKEILLARYGTDQFGRTLAHVWDGDRHINLELVRLGLAIAAPDPDEPFGKELLDAEAGARGDGTGIWGAEACGTGPIPHLVVEPSLSVFNPRGPDDEHLEDERVVVRNAGDVAVDLTGWSVRDESSRHRYSFPPGARLGPGETMIVTSDDPGWSPGGSPVWNNDGDIAIILDPSGRIADSWRYGPDD